MTTYEAITIAINASLVVVGVFTIIISIILTLVVTFYNKKPANLRSRINYK